MKVSQTRTAAAGVLAIGALAVGGVGLTACGGTTPARASSSVSPATDSSSVSLAAPSASGSTQVRDVPGGRSALVIDACTGLETICYSPQNLRTAYDATSLIDRGVNGRGQTVAVSDEVEPPIRKQGVGVSLRGSLALFDARYQMPAPKLSVSTKLAPGASADLSQVTGQGAEVELDVEMVHAMAPGAAIEVDLFKGSPATALPPVLRLAAGQGGIVSLSFGLGESCFLRSLPALESALRYDESRHVSVFAAAGDDGDLSRNCEGRTTSSAGVALPGSDPLVTAVGGTYLRLNPRTGAYAHEVVWNDQENGGNASGGIGSLQSSSTPSGTGGGGSKLLSRPSYPRGLRTPGGRRGMPDVAFDGSNATGFGAVGAIEGLRACGALAMAADKIDRKLHHGPTSLKAARSCEIDYGLGGTSVATPAWARIVALVDQQAGHPSGFLNPLIYEIGRSASYARAVSGRGTPKIAALVRLLVKDADGVRCGRRGESPASKRPNTENGERPK